MQSSGAGPTENLRCVVSAGTVELDADVFLRDGAQGLVIFAHGSGSSRHSPRNRYVSGLLNQGGLNTMLIDLLTAEEEHIDSHSGALRFNIPLLGSRLVAIGDWAMRHPRLQEMPLGYFGASTGAAAALVAAAQRPAVIGAVVSRGGRPDLADAALGRVVTPTLFIVGGEDREVIELNAGAMTQLPPVTERHLEIVSGAGHLFEEPGALDRVATLALAWFHRYLKTDSSST